jgi:hypothetical protein
MKMTQNQIRTILLEINTLIDNLIGKQLPSTNIPGRNFIKELTDLAAENRFIAKEISNEIVHRVIDERLPNVKLTILYLVDSLIKNIGFEYIDNVTPHIYRVFEDTYKPADFETRINLFKLYYAWKYFLDPKILNDLYVRFNLAEIRKFLELNRPDIIEKYDKYNENERIRREAIMSSYQSTKSGSLRENINVSQYNKQPDIPKGPGSSLMIGKKGLTESYITQLGSNKQHKYFILM